METKKEYYELELSTGKKIVFETTELETCFEDQADSCDYSEISFIGKCIYMTDWKGKNIMINPDHIVCWYDYNPYNPID